MLDQRGRGSEAARVLHGGFDHAHVRRQVPAQVAQDGRLARAPASVQQQPGTGPVALDLATQLGVHVVAWHEGLALPVDGIAGPERARQPRAHARVRGQRRVDLALGAGRPARQRGLELLRERFGQGAQLLAQGRERSVHQARLTHALGALLGRMQSRLVARHLADPFVEQRAVRRVPTGGRVQGGQTLRQPCQVGLGRGRPHDRGGVRAQRFRPALARGEQPRELSRAGGGRALRVRDQQIREARERQIAHVVPGHRVPPI